jgi:hypothetical protein
MGVGATLPLFCLTRLKSIAKQRKNMSTATQAILLTLVGHATYTRRDLRGPDGVPAVVKKGESFRVTAKVAEQLLNGDDYGTHDADGDWHPWFVEASVSADATHDFTQPTAETAAQAEQHKEKPTVTHDLDSLPKTEALSESIARTPKARSQRTVQSRARQP